MNLTTKNKKTLTLVSTIILAMFCLSFASVPLYNLFCKVTGFGGTTSVATTLPNKIGKKNFTILFDASTSPKLPWDFKVEQRKITTKAGKNNLAFYSAKNLGDKTISGTATYNVTPLKAGSYFSKIECFCFTEQALNPQEKISFPVSFYIDPEIENDPYLKDVDTITLSYTFFEKK